MRFWLRALLGALLIGATGACATIVPVSAGNAQPSSGTQHTSEGSPWVIGASSPSPASAPSSPSLTYHATGEPAAQPLPAPPVLPPATGPAVLLSPEAQQAVGEEIRFGPPVAGLATTLEDAADVLRAFVQVCPSLTNPKRVDASGLTVAADWAVPCAAASGWEPSEAAAFFAQYFETVQVGSGAAFATGYFEPEIAGSRVRRPGYDVPIYGRPADLVDVDLGLFSEDLAGKRVRGRVEGTNLVPYADRLQIEQGALSGRNLEIGWAADRIEFFFLQVQGSGRVRLPDGSVMRIGYAGQNGQPYTGIGAKLRERNMLAPGQASMQGIVDWLRANPEAGRALMNENKSYVFFRELTGPGPLGSMGYAVAAGTSAAVDPRYVPMGAPVYLSMDRGEPNGLWIAQDTGGAIRGANRFDTFWGAGAQARAIAGGMSAHGRALILLPKGTFARLSRP